MFDKFKQLNDLRRMQEQVKKEIATAEKEGVKITLNGSMEILELKLNPELPTEKQEQLVKECFHEAMKKIQASLMKNLTL